MSTVNTRTALLPALLAVIGISLAPAAIAQDAQPEESDQQFVKRMHSEFDQLDRRVANLRRFVDDNMGRSGSPGTSFGVGMSGQDRRGVDPMDSEMRRMRSKLRSLASAMEKDRARMVERYRDRSKEEFDRGYWESYMRRHKFDLNEMERDFRGY